MNQLSTVPHDTNWANIIITRLGTSRNTRYQIAPAVQSQPAASYDETAKILTSDFLRRKYGHNPNQDSEG